MNGIAADVKSQLFSTPCSRHGALANVLRKSQRKSKLTDTHTLALLQSAVLGFIRREQLKQTPSFKLGVLLPEISPRALTVASVRNGNPHPPLETI